MTLEDYARARPDLVQMQTDGSAVAVQTKAVLRESACVHHAALGGKPELLSTVIDENTRKSLAVEHAAASLGLDWKTVSWDYDDSRTLHLSVQADQSRKASLQAEMDAKFGQGKVTVE